MKYSIKPEEHELREARNAAEEAMERCKTALPKQENVEIKLAWDGRKEVAGEMGGVSGNTPSSEIILIGFNSGIDGWKETLKRTMAHEFAHSYFYEKTGGLSDFLWQWILEEALTQNFADKFYPEAHSPWKDEIGKDEIAEEWMNVKEVISEEMEYDHQLFLGGEDFPRWLGYSLAYRIGQKLLEDHDLEDFPELKRSEVVEAGDELFT